MQIILLKSQRMVMVSAWLCWLCGFVFLAFGLLETVRGRGLISIFLILCGLIFLAIGFAYANSSKRSR